MIPTAAAVGHSCSNTHTQLAIGKGVMLLRGNHLVPMTSFGENTRLSCFGLRIKLFFHVYFFSEILLFSSPCLSDSSRIYLLCREYVSLDMWTYLNIISIHDSVSVSKPAQTYLRLCAYSLSVSSVGVLGDTEDQSAVLGTLFPEVYFREQPFCLPTAFAVSESTLFFSLSLHKLGLLCSLAEITF